LNKETLAVCKTTSLALRADETRNKQIAKAYGSVSGLTEPKRTFFSTREKTKADFKQRLL
jgi:hypothetical protein